MGVRNYGLRSRHTGILSSLPDLLMDYEQLIVKYLADELDGQEREALLQALEEDQQALFLLDSYLLIWNSDQYGTPAFCSTSQQKE